MNLYFLDSKGNERLIKENTTQETAINDILDWLGANHPGFKSGYQRCWWDDHDRFWVDVGSWDEFFIMHEANNGKCEACNIDFEQNKEANQDERIHENCRF